MERVDDGLNISTSVNDKEYLSIFHTEDDIEAVQENSVN